MSNNEEKEIGLIRSILQNEITWLVFIIGGVMGFVSTVVIPLNNVQATLVQIQKDIQNDKVQIEKGISEHADLRSRLDVLETLQGIKN